MQIGMNGRFFPGNWRPAAEEIALAASQSFRALQFPGKEQGLGPDTLGAEIAIVREALERAQITAVMEIVMRVDEGGRTAGGSTASDVLRANLPAITGLPCTCVHWHFVPLQPISHAASEALEQLLIEQCIAGTDIAQAHGFVLGIEHNEPELMLFGTPESCARALEAAPQLSFVWDVNHTIPEHLAGFTAFISRMSMLHISDTPLPEVNYHLPLGMGTIPFEEYCRTLRAGSFAGPAILEIGGLPKSGGYGRDTDAALGESRALLARAWDASA